MTNPQLAEWLLEQLRYIAGPGAAVIVGMILSNFVDKTAWWTALDQMKKKVYALVASQVLALSAVVGVVVFPTLTPQVQGYIALAVFTMITSGVAVLGMEYWHTNVNQPRKVKVIPAPSPELPKPGQ